MTTIVYSGGGIAGNWADPKNWTGGRAPGATDNVQILNGQSMTVGSPVSVNAIMIINGGTDTFTGAVTTAGIGNCEGFMVCVGSTVVFAPGSSLDDGGSAATKMGGGVLQVGVGGVGNFIADGSSTAPTTITSSSGTIGKLAAGVGTVTIDDATWSMSQLLLVGAAGAGTLDVESAGKVNVGASLSVGEDTGALGTINVWTSSTITVGGTLGVGEQSGTEGAVNIGSGGAIHVGTSVSVGESSGAAGMINVESGGSFNVTTSVSLGMAAGATGIMTVGSGGTVTIGESLDISRATGATGTAVLFSGATMTVGLDVAIGSGNQASPQGAGNLTVDAGSTLDVGNRISVSAGSTLDVEGGTVSAASLIVGLTGAGTLEVDAGSHINLSNSFDIGYDTGAVGTAILSSGSTVNVDGGTAIGGGGAPSQFGTASLTIDSGANFTAQSGLTVADGSTVDLAGGSLSAALTSGTITIQAGGQITGHGTLGMRSGGDLIDTGTITAAGGTLQIDAKELTGSGAIIIGPDSTIAITAGALLTPTLSFMSGTGETLSLSSGADVKSIISGFSIGDQIEIGGIDNAVWSSSTDMLTLSDAGKTVGTLHFAGNYSNDVFSVMHAGNLGVISLHTAS